MMQDNNYKHQESLAAIAQDFYLSRLTISELSAKYSLSRYLIKKNLDEAISSGLVTVSINSPSARNFTIEMQFKKKFGIKNVYIIKNSSNPEEDQMKIIEYAAEQLQLLIEKSKVVGLTWGGAVYNVIDHFNHHVKDDLIFTQFIGENMKYHSQAGSTRMVEKAANKFSTSFTTLAGPLYIVNKKLKDELWQEPAFKQTFIYASRMDLIFMGLGTLASIDSIPCWKQNKKAIFPDINQEKIAGILYGRPYDINGNFLVSNEKDTVFGADIDTILAVPHRLAIVKSKFKAKAALGALRGHLITDLVIDEAIANRILLEAANS
ncbi:MAG: sugar-binding domain-containing protein [Liquorilactobacillus ghanensis]|uniref:sugar-binding transcriptional regulator n=1 Tax=Liquorilactobacillus ghanensis TaxID=399370 RepID=UPI0039EC460F